jgi:ABC-2 type transport system ATP-binding protein
MRQRLGLGVALLGEPEVLILDEPMNGLDPEGVRWIRRELQTFASAGGAVLLTSHQLHEVERVADRVVVLHNGTVVDDIDTLTLAHAGPIVLNVRTAAARRLLLHLRRRGSDVTADGPTALVVRGVDSDVVEEIAAILGIEDLAITTLTPTLEDAYFDLLHSEVLS